MNKLSYRNKVVSDELILSVLAPFGFQPSASVLTAIRGYVDLLQRWNRRVSLTSLDDTREILERHFGESFFGVQAVPILQGRLADVGSGAGFPGIPIKLASPQVDLVLIESNVRKAAFLSEVIRTLGLTGAQVMNRRTEEIGSLVGSLDFVTARALGHIDALLKWSRFSLRHGGKLVLWLGARDAKDVLLSGDWNWRSPVLIPTSQSRVLVIGEKN
jgi:16S rRNA (guanine527-N7)-methyltransferase